MLYSSRINQVIAFFAMVGLVAICLGILATQVSAQGPASASQSSMVQPPQNYSPDAAVYVPNGREQLIPANAALWYRFDYAGDRSPVFVKLLEGNRRGLDFKILTRDQVTHFDADGRYVGRGTAPSVTCANEICQSSDLIWQGGFPSAGTYYIRVRNYTTQAQMIQFSIDGSAMSLGPQPAPMIQATSIPQLTPTLRPTATPTAVPTMATRPPTVIASIAPTVTVANTDNRLSLSTLGYAEKQLNGPFDSADYVFALPADWQLDNGATVVLTINTTSNSNGSTPLPSATLQATFGGILQVYFNDLLQATIQLDQVGERTIVIPLQKDSLNPARRSGRHDLKLFLDSAVNCVFDWHTTVIVRASSYFVLPRHMAPLPTDLRLLPRPIYQQLFMPESAVVVVPDQPSPSELDAALAIAAGFGQMTNGKLGISLIPVAQLNTDLQSTSHLILVGRPAAFPLLNQLQLPGVVSDTGFSLPGIQPGSGIIQMVASPWNPSKVVLVVSGASDLGVHKAGQAVSSGTIKVSTRPNLAVVADVRSDLVVNSALSDRTLENLGYPNVTLEGFGDNSSEYRFYVPLDQVVNADAYLNLSFNHSTLLEYDRSGAVLYLNDEPIGSIRFNDDTANKGLIHIAIPSTAIHPGTNRLTIEAELVPRSVCVDPRLAFLWLTIRSDSLLHIPLAPATEKTGPRVLDLATYPSPFVQDPTLGNVGFVLPSKDPAAWNIAARIAFDLGNAAKPGLADLAVAFGDEVPDNLRKTRDLLIVGRPSTLPIIEQLKDGLPAYFAPGSDLAIERTVRVIYQVPEGAHIGYLELLSAPWSSKRLILNVLGSSDQGLQWAGNALTVSRLRGQLRGDYAFINGDQIVNGDTSMGPRSQSLLATVVPVTTKTTSTSQVPAAQPAEVAERPAWILPLIGVAIAVMVLILIVVLASAMRQRSTGH